VHIADGILPAGPLIAAHAAALAGVWLAGRKIASEEVVRMGMVAAAVFSVSMVHFPIGGTSIHLGLYGVAGVLLGRRSFPVAFVTLLFQALIAQHGGLLTLGLNTINMAAGMLIAAAVWKLSAIGEPTRAFLAGFLGAMLPAAMVAAEFWLAGYGKGFGVIATAYSAVALIEAALTTFIIGYLRRVKPAILARIPA
jgi:cobalt/nickel transport system permease protein